MGVVGVVGVQTVYRRARYAPRYRCTLRFSRARTSGFKDNIVEKPSYPYFIRADWAPLGFRIHLDPAACGQKEWQVPYGKGFDEPDTCGRSIQSVRCLFDMDQMQQETPRPCPILSSGSPADVSEEGSGTAVFCI